MFNKLFLKKAFTLIELLVVIAIVGILSSIVLVSLQSARQKAKDARLRTDASQVRGIAEMIYDDNDSFEALCDGSGDLNTAIDQLREIRKDIDAQLSGGINANDFACYADANDYCLSVKIKIGDRFYCVDSSGLVTEAAAITCAGGNIDCTP